MLVVIPHDGDDDAVTLANDSPYGLSGSVWSADRERARGRGQPDPHRHGRHQRRAVVQPRRALRRVQQSGIGRESGVAGFEEYLETKSMAEPA